MNKNLSRAKKLIMIPLVILAITFVCLLLASILEIPAGRGFIYSVCALIGVMSIFLSPLPCLLMSLLGTIFAAKALKEGEKEARLYLIMGLSQVLIFILVLVIAIAMFIGGQSV
ncbi:MAG: hypothetical protein IKN47_06770 [Lachnospiraceae bacterium]|nr:hypothetical protein [Lachnospiraceae bacterium]